MDDLDDLIARIDELDDGDEDFTWHDAAAWVDPERTPLVGGPDGDDPRADGGDPEVDLDWDEDWTTDPTSRPPPPMVMRLSRDHTDLLTYDMIAAEWGGEPDLIEQARALVDSDINTDRVAAVGRAMLNIADEVDAEPNIEVYVAIAPKQVNGDVLTAQHPDGRSIRWDNGEWTGDTDLIREVAELLEVSANQSSMRTLAEAMIAVTIGGTHNGAAVRFASGG